MKSQLNVKFFALQVLTFITFGFDSAETMASFVVPEVTRNGKTANSSSLAVVWQERTLVGLSLALEDTKTEEDGVDSEEKDQVLITPFAAFHALYTTLRHSVAYSDDRVSQNAS